MTSAHIPFKGLDHSYGAPVWNWEEDYSAATASFSCFFGDDTQTIDATITTEVVENPTIDEGGKIKYTASVPFGDQTYTDERWDTTQKLEHVEKVFPTADNNGHIEYWYNGRYYSDANGEHEITEAETVIPYFTFGNDGGYIKLISYNGKRSPTIIPMHLCADKPSPSSMMKHSRITPLLKASLFLTVSWMLTTNPLMAAPIWKLCISEQVSIILPSFALRIVPNWKKSPSTQRKTPLI